jgi:Rrf2 family protein
MNISARADYALRALLALAAEPGGGMLKGEALAVGQGLPFKFLETILQDLRRAGLVSSRRGGDGGYSLTRPADSISVAEVIRIADGPLATVRGALPDLVEYTGAAEHLSEVWLTADALLADLFESISLADIVTGSVILAAALRVRRARPDPVG